MLGALGLDVAQETAYRALVGPAAAEVADLAHRLGVPEAETAGVDRTTRRPAGVAASGRPAVPMDPHADNSSHGQDGWGAARVRRDAYGKVTFEHRR